MAIARVNAPSPVTQAGASLSQSLTSVGDADCYFLVTQRGGSGSPTSVTYKGVTASAAGGLFQITGSARFGRWYRIARASAPASGSGTMAVSWAGVDNIGVGLVEYRGDGTLSVSTSTEISDGSTPLTFTLTALAGDVTLVGCMGNSAAPGFSPTTGGVTELLESTWFSNTGHVIWELAGPSTSVAGTASGSTCGGALVIHEESTGITGSASITLGAVTCSATASLSIEGSASVTLGALTCSAEGSLALSGSASITLGTLTCSASASLGIDGSASIVLGALTCTAEGGTTLAGEALIVLGALTCSGSASLALEGQASVTLGAITCSASGSIGWVPIEGESTITLGALTCSGAGTLAIAGTATVTLGSLVCSGSGSLAIEAAATVVLGALVCAAAGFIGLGPSGPVRLVLGDPVPRPVLALGEPVSRPILVLVIP